MAYNKALVAYDGSEHGKQALAAAFEFVDHNLVRELVVLHVTATHRGVEPMLEAGGMFGSSDVEVLFEDSDSDKTKCEIESLVASHEEITEIVMRVGAPKTEIAHVTEAHACDLIIMGSRGLGAVRSMLGNVSSTLGSVSSAVLAEAEVPVFIVR